MKPARFNSKGHIMNLRPIYGVGFVLVTILSTMGAGGGCENTTDTQKRQTEDILSYADKKTGGMPRIINYFELAFAKRIMAKRDDAISTVTYVQNISNGKFLCIGKSIGYGLPYAVEITNPLQYIGQGGVIAQADPNGLYMPQSAEGTWVDLIDPVTGKDDPVYSEPRAFVSPFELPAAVVDVPCSVLGYGPSPAKK
jgi:hypothetical protein